MTSTKRKTTEVRHEFKFDSTVGANVIKVWDFPGTSDDYEAIQSEKPEKFKKKKVVPILYLRERLKNLFDKVEIIFYSINYLLLRNGFQTLVTNHLDYSLT